MKYTLVLLAMLPALAIAKVEIALVDARSLEPITGGDVEIECYVVSPPENRCSASFREVSPGVFRANLPSGAYTLRVNLLGYTTVEYPLIFDQSSYRTILPLGLSGNTDGEAKVAGGVSEACELRSQTWVRLAYLYGGGFLDGHEYYLAQVVGKNGSFIITKVQSGTYAALLITADPTEQKSISVLDTVVFSVGMWEPFQKIELQFDCVG